MSDKERPSPPSEDEMVTLRRADYEALLDRLEDAEDTAAVLRHRHKRNHLWLTSDEVDCLLKGVSPVKVWRKKRELSLESLAAMAGISKSFLSEIEHGKATASVDTLRKLAHELKVDLDSLVP
jgi:ribosome-binding protein aMBF1 (putative translation factor)